MKWWDLRQRLRTTWEKLKAEQATPERLGFAIGVGVFVGCSPFHGFQWILALALAWLLRLNKIAVMIGLQISAFPATILIIFASVQLGEMMLHHRLLPLSLTEVRTATEGAVARTIVVDLAVGGLTMGIVLGTLLGGLTMVLLRRRQRRKARAAE